MSTSYEGFSAAQVAWMCRAAQLGRTLHVKGQFTAKAVERAVDGLRRLLIQPEEIRNVPKVLSDCGIRLVVVQHLSTTKIDGACIWLDKKSPVIALSLRHGRIDAFWFTLMHELGHVARGDGMGNALLALDEHLADEEEQADQRPRFEIEADDFAEEALVSQEALKNFIRRKGPLFSERDIRGFAMLHEVHPGVVVGQLHHQWSKKPGHGVHWSKFRKLLIQAREHILGVALTDGFGHAVPTVP
jgi:HTH-type transcriptional regulator/antitoxin HigA